MKLPAVVKNDAMTRVKSEAKLAGQLNNELKLSIKLHKAKRQCRFSWDNPLSHCQCQFDPVFEQTCF